MFAFAPTAPSGEGMIHPWNENMHTTAKRIETGNLAGDSPGLTRPVVIDMAGRGRAVLFADVCRSMNMTERLGDQAAQAVIDQLLGMAIASVKACGGHVVKTINDEILAVLPTADAAARAACELMRKVDLCEPQGGIAPGMHVGFHAGTFIELEGDIFGDAVNIASRLTGYAASGQILTTTLSAGGISPLVRRAMRRLGSLDIRGRQEEMEVEEIAWQDNDEADTTVTAALHRISPGANSRLVLRLGLREWTVGPQARHLAIGRDPCADIVIGATQASRNHGVIEYRNGGFFYADKSLNGSFVTFGDSGESLVQRSQVSLSGQGVICFGHSASEPGERLAFHIEGAEQRPWPVSGSLTRMGS
jgi:adenylate cyclase